MHNWRPGESITAARLRSGYAAGTAVLDFSTGTLIAPANSAYDANIWTQSVNITFPAGAFTTTPVVTVAGQSNAPQNVLEILVNAITPTGCVIWGARATQAATTVHWQAIEIS